jgi:hypothetical protein
MFVALAIFIRTRRQRFTEQWNKHNIGDDAVFEDIGQSLETTTKILNEDIHKTS